MVKVIIGTRLKKMRLNNDMTIEFLAQKSNVSSNMISRIERGLTTPSVEVLMKLAGSFDMSISYFIDEAYNGSAVVYTPDGKGEPIFFFEDKHHINSLTHGLRDPGFTVLNDILDDGCNSGAGMMVHSGEEFAMVLDGEMEFIIDGTSYPLSKGGSLSFKAHLPHRWINTNKGKTSVLWVISQSHSNSNQHA